jgi:hypothetical protein
MTSTQITTVLLIGQATITLSIALRAFSLYSWTRKNLLFILGMSMGMIAAVGIIGLISDNYFAKSFSTKWFRYTAQIVSYTFLFLCAINSSEKFIQRVKQWQLLFIGLLAVMLLLTPLLPQFANPLVEASVSFLRAVICFIICLTYVSLFMKKETRFSLLMALSFLLISFGIALTTPWYFEPATVLYLYIGDTMRTAGLLLLLITYFIA